MFIDNFISFNLKPAKVFDARLSMAFTLFIDTLSWWNKKGPNRSKLGAQSCPKCLSHPTIHFKMRPVPFACQPDLIVLLNKETWFFTIKNKSDTLYFTWWHMVQTQLLSHGNPYNEALHQGCSISRRSREGLESISAVGGKLNVARTLRPALPLMTARLIKYSLRS